jgi:hypothetical protein
MSNKILIAMVPAILLAATGLASAKTLIGERRMPMTMCRAPRSIP